MPREAGRSPIGSLTDVFAVQTDTDVYGSSLEGLQARQRNIIHSLLIKERTTANEAIRA